jgi:predicted ABC-type ATPase
MPFYHPFGGRDSTKVDKVTGESLVADTEIAKIHTQNTDTGTTSTTFQVDSDNTGPKIKNNSGVLEARNAADDAYAQVAMSVAQLTDAVADTTLSGTPKIFELKDSAGTSYYIKAYPTKA